VSSHFRRTHAPLVVTLPAYSRAACTHTSSVLTRRSSFSRYPSHPGWSHRGALTRLGWARCSRGIRHARHGLIAVLSHALCGSLFSRYPSCPVWSRRGPLTQLAWARCSRGICHARHGLVAVLSHALRGLVVLAVSVTPGVVSSRSSHMPCVGSLFVWGLVVAALILRVERGRSVERDNRLRGEESPD